MNKSKFVYVLDKNGEPLMPTKRFGKVRRMIRDNLAIVKSLVPFTIQLTYETKTHETQDLYLGIDPGRTNIGTAVINKNGQCLYRSHVITRNKDIPKLMFKRRAHRHASRQGERFARKRLAYKFNTTMKSWMQRILPGYDKPVIVKDIINTESKFNNRKYRDGWITPTAFQLLKTHINITNKICQILPITDISIEFNKFVFMSLDDPTIYRHKEDFQNGALSGYKNLHEAVFDIQNGKCILCEKNNIEEYHHVLPMHLGGANTINNIVGLCSSCHKKVHTDKLVSEKLNSLHTKAQKKYGALNILNQIMPRIVEELENMFPNHVYIVMGYETKELREAFRLVKDHDIDAYCIAVSALDVAVKDPESMPETYKIIQFRRHNRANIKCQHERTYKFNGITVAKNRHKRMEQKDAALYDWYIEQKKIYGKQIADDMRSKLQVKKSERIYYPDPKARKFTPGDVVLYHGKRYIVTGQKDNGKRLLFYGYKGKSFYAQECLLERRNAGLEYVP